MSDNKKLLRSHRMFVRMAQELEFKREAEGMTDGELALELIREVWAHSELWTRPAVLVDEAITRLKRADTRRRWQERKERRQAQGVGATKPPPIVKRLVHPTGEKQSEGEFVGPFRVG